MGCGGSKTQASEEIPLPPQPRPGTSRTRPPTHRHSRQGPPTGTQPSDTRRGSHSRRPPTADRRLNTAERRLNTAERRLNTAERRERQARRSSRIPGTTEETEDIVIQHRLDSLATMINQHSLNFYRASAELVSHEIGRGIVDGTILGDDDGTPPQNPRLYFTRAQLQVIATTVASRLSHRLAKYTSVQAVDRRDEHLAQLCEAGASVRGLIDNNPSNWAFGPWDRVRFPSVLRNGQVVLEAKI